MVDWNPAIWFASYLDLYEKSLDHAVKNRAIKTIDNGLNRDLLNFRHLKMLWQTLFFVCQNISACLTDSMDHRWPLSIVILNSELVSHLWQFLVLTLSVLYTNLVVVTKKKCLRKPFQEHYSCSFVFCFMKLLNISTRITTLHQIL